jgi:hypothetical protein
MLFGSNAIGLASVLVLDAESLGKVRDTRREARTTTDCLAGRRR